MSTNQEILINEEVLNSIKQYTLELKESLSSVFGDICNANKNFVQASEGKFAQAFMQESGRFERDMQEHIQSIDTIQHLALTTLEQQNRLDAKIAQKMK